MRKISLFTSRSILFVLLTILTQIGGLAFLISLWLNKKWKVSFRLKALVSFLGVYLLFTFIIIPILAPLWGREKVKYIRPVNYMTVFLNRNYIRPELNNLLKKTTVDLEGSNIKIHFLDANFPFINKFPLLPHLSHNDGKKMDLSLIYETKNGTISDQQKSNSGYGVFEAPKKNEPNQIQKCLDKGYFQYDYPKYLTFGRINADLVFSEKGTKKLIKSLLLQKELGKLFIEPHLKQRLGLNDPRIRYHGCRAVRHDDHIHIQLK